MSINKLFDISRRSLLTYQAALNATSNNISNASNPEYSRQRVILGAERPEYTANLSFGSGVKIEDIRRVRDSIIDSQIWSFNSKSSFAGKQASTLSKLEALLSEPSELGLSNLTAQFFNSWDKLAVDPSSTALRNNVLNTAQNLSGKMENIYEGYTQVKKDLKLETSQTVESINSYLQQIHTLNKEIYAVKAGGNTPNDLLDKRGAIVNELSKLANLNVTYNQDETISISIGGVYAVDRLYGQKFKVEENANGKLNIVTEDGASKMALNMGELSANLNMYNKVIPEYQQKINEIGQAIFNSVNSIHATGQTNTTPPQTNVSFFSNFANGVLEINQNILDDPNLIAASSNGDDGNNETALKIAALQEALLISGDTISNSYSNFVNKIANDLQTHNQNAESYQLVLNQLDMQVSEASGVSVDEEMVNVLKFQRSYDAAAKLIKVADEMFQTLLTAF
ncbi:MAG: flagellar hook-associated protein FlgK [Melioribacteraceae bacterium]|nr:MAG: flagellar hook-associated protein FlgK [Melioribacteraceae bacterium]